MAESRTPTPAPAAAPAQKAKRTRTKRVLTSFEESLKSEQAVSRSIARKLAGLSEEARARVIQMLNQYTQKA